ncbi:unnamed protein product, partial [Owenia fusiformis]
YDIDKAKSSGVLEKIQIWISNFFKTHEKTLGIIVFVFLVIAWFVYLVFAIRHSIDGALVSIVMTALITTGIIYGKIRDKYATTIYSRICGRGCEVRFARTLKYMKWVCLLLVLAGIVVFLVMDAGQEPKRLVSAGGMVVLIMYGFLTSTNPSKIKWRPVLWGIGLQLILGLLILRWPPGYQAFRFLGNQVRYFLEYTDSGSKFVFGDTFEAHPFIFKVMPIVIFFSCIVSVMYHWGIMQILVGKTAWLMQFTLGTTAVESLNAAANIFLSGGEAAIMLEPFIERLTMSELHAIMTNACATVAGFIMAMYIGFGAPPEHLLTAAIMSAPAALAFAKLNYPETEVSSTRSENDVALPKGTARNAVDAACTGAVKSLKLCGAICANLIAFIATMEFLNSILGYLGRGVGYDELSFQKICSWLFYPLAFVMGCEQKDAELVASLIGTKIFVDEVISYRDLGYAMQEGLIGARSGMIATYSLCGFGSIAAMGIIIGVLGAIAPSRRADISQVAVRALINGNVAGFMTACMAGMLCSGDETRFGIIINSNATEGPIPTMNTSDYTIGVASSGPTITHYNLDILTTL